MAKVTCPNCKTEFEIVNPEDSHFCGYHPIPKTNEVIGELIPASEPKKSVNAKGETKMANRGTTMEEMMAMVMENQKKMAEMMVSLADKGETAVPVSSEKKGGKFGKTSKYYGKEICGFMYDPYMVARWSPDKFRGWMRTYNLNVDMAIKNEVSLMESINFCIKECSDLAFMQKHNPIAFEERKHFWSVGNMRYIFIDYWQKVQKEIQNAVDDGLAFYRKHNKLSYIKFHGTKIDVKVNLNVHSNGSSRPFTVPVIQFVDWSLPRMIKDVIEQLEGAYTYEDLYKIMSVRQLVNLQNAYRRVWSCNFEPSYVPNEGYENNTLSPVFIEGYKKRGAYYTMKDDIMFHGLGVNGLHDREAVAYISTLLNSPSYSVYKVYKIARGYSSIPGRN